MSRTKSHIEPRKTNLLQSLIRRISGEDFRVDSEWIHRHRGFAFYCFVLVIGLIWNGHSTENLIRSIERTERENKELRSEYISALSQLMSRSRQSALAEMLDGTGIHESKNPPVKITIHE